MRNLMIVMVGLVVSACAAPQITLPAGAAALLYADAKAYHARAEVRIADACKAGRLDAEACKDLAATNQRLKVADEVVRAQIGNPQTPTDWAKVLQYLGLALEIAGKVAVP